MRLPVGLRYGTDRYPEPVARRLRVLNLACWMSALGVTGFAIHYLASPLPGGTRAGGANAVAAVLLAAIPLLHRFGPLHAPLAFAIVANAGIFVVCSIVGTDTGMPVQYLVVMAIVTVTLGIDRVRLVAAFAVLAAALFVVTELIVPADTGLQPRSDTVASLIAGSAANSAVLFAIIYYSLRDTARAEAEAEHQFRRSENLLLNILPVPIAERLKGATHPLIADRFESASVLFADMAGFTARASDTDPQDLVRFLNRVFSKFDHLTDRHRLEKIKTTGDSYMVVSGVPEPRPDHAEALADFAIEMRDEALALRDLHGRSVGLRIGIASGPVVAGVVGTSKFFFDVWGDTVNVASRMETTGEIGQIHVAPDTYQILRERFELAPRGFTEVKGKGRMATWVLIGRRPEAGGA